MSDMIKALQILATGRPAPQGSKQRGSAGQLLESSPHLPAWRKAVRVAAWAAMAAAGIEPRRRPVFPDGAVAVKIQFYVHDSGPGFWPVNVSEHGDIDKLTRSTLDALTQAGVWRDDAQVALLEVQRLRTSENPGALIEIVSI